MSSIKNEFDGIVCAMVLEAEQKYSREKSQWKN